MPEHPGTDLVPGGDFELDQRRAKAYAESGYWKDANSIARALVKIEAGRALGLPAIVAMSEINVIHERPDIGAGALAALVKSSGRYDYRVKQLDDNQCVIFFYDRGDKIGESSFSIADAERAGLTKRNPTYKTYPRNMLFARAISNGVAWYCPDVTMGRVYVDRELEDAKEIPNGIVESVDLRVVDEQLQEAEFDAEDADFEPIPASPIDEETQQVLDELGAEEVDESPFVAPETRK